MKQGTVLGTYPGTVVPLTQGLAKLEQFPQCEVYIWRFRDSQYVIDPTDSQGVLQNECRGGTGPTYWLFEALPILAQSTTLCRINEPPRGSDVNVITREEGRTVTLLLEKDVEAGVELFMDYGATYNRSGYSNNKNSNNNR
jgi:hypothetical protein